MKRIMIFLIACVIMPIYLFSAGSSETEGQEDGKLKVFVSILPQKYFVEQIGGDRVEVEVMVPPGKSPATYEPAPRQVIELGNAEIFFTIGVEFEAGFIPVIKENLPNLHLVETDRDIEKRSIDSHDHEEDGDHDNEEHMEEEPEGEDHDNEVPDPHIWMDPVLVKHQAEIIRDGLIEADPEGRELYFDNFAAFSVELDELDREIASVLDGVRGSTFFVYHPAFGYFADRYGLVQAAVETGGREPGPGKLEEIIEHAREEGVKVIFVQPEFPESSARAVADSINGAVVPVAPLRYDYLESMRELAESVREGLSR